MDGGDCKRLVLAAKSAAFLRSLWRSGHAQESYPTECCSQPSLPGERSKREVCGAPGFGANAGALRGTFVAVEASRRKVQVHAGIRSWSTAVGKMPSPALRSGPLVTVTIRDPVDDRK